MERGREKKDHQRIIRKDSEEADLLDGGLPTFAAQCNEGKVAVDFIVSWSSSIISLPKNLF